MSVVDIAGSEYPERRNVGPGVVSPIRRIASRLAYRDREPIRREPRAPTEVIREPRSNGRPRREGSTTEDMSEITGTGGRLPRFPVGRSCPFPCEPRSAHIGVIGHGAARRSTRSRSRFSANNARRRRGSSALNVASFNSSHAPDSERDECCSERERDNSQDSRSLE